MGDGWWNDRLTMILLDNFCTVFISFISWLNRKICVPRLLVTVRVFCIVKNWVTKNAPELIILGQKMIFFWRKWPSPLLHTRPLLAATSPRPLTEILNMPLYAALPFFTPSDADFWHFDLKIVTHDVDNVSCKFECCTVFRFSVNGYMEQTDNGQERWTGYNA